MMEMAQTIGSHCNKHFLLNERAVWSFYHDNRDNVSQPSFLSPFLSPMRSSFSERLSYHNKKWGQGRKVFRAFGAETYLAYWHEMK